MQFLGRNASNNIQCGRHLLGEYRSPVGHGSSKQALQQLLGILIAYRVLRHIRSGDCRTIQSFRVLSAAVILLFVCAPLTAQVAYDRASQKATTIFDSSRIEQFVLSSGTASRVLSKVNSTV